MSILLSFPFFEIDEDTVDALCNVLLLAPVFERQFGRKSTKGIQKHLTQFISATIFYSSVTNTEDSSVSADGPD